MIWLRISGGKGQYMAYFVLLHTHLRGHGCNGVGRRKCSNCVNLFVPNMIMLVYALVVHVRSTKDSRSILSPFQQVIIVEFLNASRDIYV